MMLDFIGLALIVLFFIRGYMKGIIVAVFSVLAILLGVVCALKLSHLLASYLLEKGWVTSGWGQLISYIILFVGVILIVRLIAKAIENAIGGMPGVLNKIIGCILYAALAIVVWSSILWLCNRMHLLTPEGIASSKTYHYISPIAPWVFEQVGKLLPFAKDTFHDLQRFFEKVDQTLPDHVGFAR
jgi:membrane protein required for colicin V production